MYGPSPEERIAMARRLLSRSRLTEALDVLNEAVRMDPRYPDTFDCRADVFEQMGMYPHAQADRRKASDLRASVAPAVPAAPPVAPPPPVASEQPPDAEPEPPTAAAIPLPEPEPTRTPTSDVAPPPEAVIEEDGEPDAVADLLEEAGVEGAVIEPPPQPVYDPEPYREPERSPVPVYRGPPRPSVSGAMMRAAGVVLVALGLFVAGGVGIYLALDAISGDDDPSVASTATPTPVASGAEGGDAPTDDGGPQTVEDALRGDPYGFSSVQTAFEGAGFAVTLGDFSDTVTGFSEEPVNLAISRDGLSMEMSVLMYDSEDAPNADWVLGTPTTPKGEGIVPVGSTVWYNQNVVMVILVSDETLREDALEAFLDLG